MFTLSFHSMSSSTGIPMISRRMGSIQPFWRSVSREDDRYIGTQVGVITYDKDDRYQMSYLEAGFRSDHIVDGLLRIGDKNHTSQSSLSPSEYDVDIVIPADDEIQTRPHVDRLGGISEETNVSDESQQVMAVVA